MAKSNYDAVLVVSFGGPEGMADVLPFLENVLRGKNVPRERMLEVAEHYRQFGGLSPLNAQNRSLIAALEAELRASGIMLPIYWGNRNWHPLLPDTLRKMAADGIRRALAFVTSAYSSYSSCRQYLENIEQAREEVGPSAPQVDKLRAFFNHPGFIEPQIERAREALERISRERRDAAKIVFTAHSIPSAMAAGCAYEAQLGEASRLVADGMGSGVFFGSQSDPDFRAASRTEKDSRPLRRQWDLAFQSRSGPPSQSWLEPDIREWLRAAKANGAADVVIVPIGFISDHVEVIYDLDIEARGVCEALGINMVRAATVGTHPRFIRMIRELIVERIESVAERPALGTLGPGHDVCPADCCPSGRSK
jgi:protoporphyrin/coproporphyrin ferrochelatase